MRLAGAIAGGSGLGAADFFEDVALTELPKEVDDVGFAFLWLAKSSLGSEPAIWFNLGLGKF